MDTKQPAGVPSASEWLSTNVPPGMQFQPKMPPIPMPGGVAAVGIGENLGKMRRVALPLLLLHGDEDVVTPPSQATALHAASAASDKQLTFIKGKGHNVIHNIGAQRQSQHWCP